MQQTYKKLGIVFEYQWPEPPEKVQADAIALWQSQGALPGGNSGTDRAKEVLGAAYEDDNLLGVCTASLRHVPDLEGRFFYYRTFAAKSARLKQVSVNLLNFAHDFLEGYSQSQPDSEGIYIEVENPFLMKHQNEGIWFESRLVYIGNTPQGWHRRVRYFDHSRLP